MTIHTNVALAPLTTIEVGGPARFFIEARSAEDVCAALDFASREGVPVFVLGGGSNLVVSDKGFDGLVIKIATNFVRVSEHALGTEFVVGAGVDWDEFVRRAVEQNCAGVECLSGIPGTVGGTPVQNVGAYGQDVAETITRVTAINLHTLEERTFTREECTFAYRTSRFNSSERNQWVILDVTFLLHLNGAPKISYADLKREFPNGTPSISAVREAVLRIRRSKGMVLDENDPDSRSAGSFFKNPIVFAEEYDRVRKRAQARGLTLPSYPALDAQKKIAAAWLLEQSGFGKGFIKGRVGISSKHSLALVNRGGATAAEVIALKNEIQSAVARQFGIELRPEPVFLGFRDPV